MENDEKSKKEQINEKVFNAHSVDCSALISVAEFLPESQLRLGFVKNAEAIIGRPLTPMSYAGVARRSMYREAAWSRRCRDERCRCQRCCRKYGLRERCCGPGCCRKYCCCAGSGGERGCCRGRRPASCRWPAHRHDGAVAASWMRLDGHRRGELFPMRRRLLPGRFSGKQRGVYRVGPLRGEWAERARVGVFLVTR